MKTKMARKKFASFLKLFNFLCFFIAFTPEQPCFAADYLSGHLQLLVVVSNGWHEMQGSLQCFERTHENDAWEAILPSVPVVLGKSGMSKGIGLFQILDENVPSKVEGDLKSPAGIFSLGTAFGFLSKSHMTHVKMDYFQLNEFTEAVDDPSSAYYNYIVDSRDVTRDWKSSEKMRMEPLYEIGFAVNHNLPNPKPGKGSAIFFHIWRSKQSGTAGCTAMSYDDLENLMSWIEKNKNPVLIQLPRSVYFKLQPEWDLPNISNS